MYGIWCLDRNNNCGDWLRCLVCGKAVLVFERKADACRWAAKEYGFDTYTEAAQKGWCKLRKLEPTP